MVRRGVRNGRRIISHSLHPSGPALAPILIKFNLFFPLCLVFLSGSTLRTSATITDKPNGIDSAGIVRLSQIRRDLRSFPDSLSLFWHSIDTELPSANSDAYWLMNRMMQMKVEAESVEEDLTGLDEDVGDCIADYGARIGRISDKCVSETLATQGIENPVTHYSGCNQPELNTWTDIMTVLSRFRTINLYERLITSVDLLLRKQAHYREFMVAQAI